MTDEQFNFWQAHSLKYLEMAFRYDNQGRLEAPDGYGQRTGECGDTVEMFIGVSANRIESITYQVQGCINTNACANTVIRMAEDKNVDEVWAITPEMVVEYLETLPKNHWHCAELAVGALYQALADYNRKH
ncbi:MAG: iron-sulfur cluster assembly scaffold protein [Desulfosalsimonadaceae bacterium]